MVPQLFGSDGKFFKLAGIDERTHSAYGLSNPQADDDYEIADYIDTTR